MCGWGGPRLVDATLFGEASRTAKHEATEMRQADIRRGSSAEADFDFASKGQAKRVKLIGDIQRGGCMMEFCACPFKGGAA